MKRERARAGLPAPPQRRPSIRPPRLPEKNRRERKRAVPRAGRGANPPNQSRLRETKKAARKRKAASPRRATPKMSIRPMFRPTWMTTRMSRRPFPSPARKQAEGKAAARRLLPISRQRLLRHPLPPAVLRLRRLPNKEPASWPESRRTNGIPAIFLVFSAVRGLFPAARTRLLLEQINKLCYYQYHELQKKGGSL